MSASRQVAEPPVRARELPTAPIAATGGAVPLGPGRLEQPAAEPTATRPAHPRLTLLALVVLIVATAFMWTEVVTRLKDPDPPPARGTPTGVVWSDRVFRSEAGLAAWFGRRGLHYARWARTHPEAAAILRAADAPKTAARRHRARH